MCTGELLMQPERVLERVGEVMRSGSNTPTYFILCGNLDKIFWVFQWSWAQTLISTAKTVAPLVLYRINLRANVSKLCTLITLSVQKKLRKRIKLDTQRLFWEFPDFKMINNTYIYLTKIIMVSRHYVIKYSVNKSIILYDFLIYLTNLSANSVVPQLLTV